MNIEIVAQNQLCIPTQATAGSAGHDLRANKSVVIYPGHWHMVPCGFSLAIPPGHVGMVCSRSGIAKSCGVIVLNAPGIIDSDYRGEVGVILMNMGKREFLITPGDRIAQLLIVPISNATMTQVDQLDSTERGSGGFGSTGCV